MTNLICPVCGASLQDQGASYRCPQRHTFDKAKSGYVNLLPASGTGKRHGDDKLMVRARRDFLSCGYYDLFSNAIAALALELLPQNGVVLDSGCGEGKYTQDVSAALDAAGKHAEIIGIDISRDAVAYAGKRCRNVRFAAASCAAIPLADASVDLLLNIFSPFQREEYLRVLKAGGYLLRAYPLEKHLLELKQLVYDTPYLNPVEDMAEEGFSLERTEKVCYSIQVKSNENLKNLFMMTPYYYKTGREDQAKLDSVESAQITLEFAIAVYRKL